jgi:hypothetical protein
MDYEDIKILYAQPRGDEFAIAIEVNGKRYDGYLRIVEELDR